MMAEESKTQGIWSDRNHVLYLVIFFSMLGSFLLLDIPSIHADEALSQAENLFKAGKYAEAKRRFTSYLSSHKNDPAALFYMGKLESNGAKSEAYFRKLIATDPKHPLADNALLEMAQLYYSTGFYVTARQDLLRLLKEYPTSDSAPEARYQLGLCSLAMNKPAEAKTQFESFLKKYPKSDIAPRAEIGLINALFMEGKYEQVIDEAKDFLEKYADQEVKSQAIYAMAQSYEKLGNPQKANEVYQELLKECPSSYEATLVADKTLEREPEALSTQTEPFTVQVGAFANTANALALKKNLSVKGYQVRLNRKTVGETVLNLVWVGAYKTKGEAEAVAKTLKEKEKLPAKIVDTR